MNGNNQMANSNGSITIHNNYNSNVVAIIGKQKGTSPTVGLPSINKKGDLNQTI